MLLRSLHLLLLAAYIALPAAALVLALIRRVRGRPLAISRITLTLATALGLALGICWSYAISTGGRLTVRELALAAYFATAMLLLLRLLDVALRWILRIALRVKVDPRGHPLDPRNNRAQLAVVLRMALLIMIGLSFVLSALLVYRPRVRPAPTPAALPFVLPPHQTVTFPSIDGLRLSAWWIPSQDRAADTADTTLLLCHGLDADRTQPLLPAVWLMARGYNVLSFDFRAHGDSAGHLVSFGARERDDVLGAVRWLKANHPDAARRIYALGINTGAVALIAAAADPSPEGRAIDALAVYAPYDHFTGIASRTTLDLLVPPIRWLTLNLSVPLASAHTGANLAGFAPAELAEALWPRPILVMYGERDDLIDFHSSWRFFQSAYHPKDALWLDGGLNEFLQNPRTADALTDFFDEAHPLPAI